MNDRIDDLIALAALGELTEPESTELDAAVRADPAVGEELADALASAAALQTSPLEQPPPVLRASVLGVIAGLAQDPTATRVEATTAIEPLRHRRRSAPLLAAAAALLLVVAGAIVVTNRDGADDPIAAVVEADDATETAITGEMGALEMWYSPDQHALVLTGTSLVPLPSGSTYQVWLVDDSGAELPASVGTFEPDADGGMVMRVDDADPAGSVVKITLEPAGGSPQPTGPVMASA